jgi:hypothetical protein
MRASGGKSQGNIRGQHDHTWAVGRVDELICDDDDEAISIRGTIFDPQAIKLILEGVLTGLSVAGSYVRQWAEGGINWYTARP